MSADVRALRGRDVERSPSLFHTQISWLLNLSRLSARQVITDVVEARIPLASKEGFVRQILGWREYMHHVHDATDCFRLLAGLPQPEAAAPNDGGYARWRGEPWQRAREGASAGGDGGALASFLGAAPSRCTSRRVLFH